jgi:hypothetical protein
MGVMERRTSSHRGETPYWAHGWHSARDGRRLATTSPGRCGILFERIKRSLLPAPWPRGVSHSGWTCSAHPCQQFRRYEDASLHYVGVMRRRPLDIGISDTALTEQAFSDTFESIAAT